MPFRRTMLKASTFAAVGAGLSLSLATPSKAVISCAGNNSDLFLAGFTCAAGDKLYSDFTLLEGHAALQAGTFTIQDNDPSHSLSLTGSFGVGTYSFSYKMAVNPPTSAREFGIIETSVSSAVSGTRDATKTLKADYTIPVVGTAGPITATFGAAAPPANPSNPSATAAFPSGVKEAIFTSTLVVNQGTMTLFDDNLTQNQLDKTPGPLSILGATAAFGFSRKLRRRVKQLA